MDTFLAWYTLTFQAVGVAAAIMLIGKPRKPTTGGVAVLTLLFATPIVLLAIRVLQGS